MNLSATFARLSRREKTILAAGGLIIWATLFVVFALLPVQSNLRKVKADYDSNQALLVNARAVKRQEARMDARLAEIDQALKALEATIPGQKEVDDFLFYIADAERQTGVKVLSLKPAAGSAVKEYMQYPYDVVVEGPYPGLAQFVFKVENYPRMVRLQSFHAVPETAPATTLGAGGAVAATKREGYVRSEFTVIMYTVPSKVIPKEEEAQIFRVPVGRPNPFLPVPR